MHAYVNDIGSIYFHEGIYIAIYSIIIISATGTFVFDYNVCTQIIYDYNNICVWYIWLAIRIDMHNMRLLSECTFFYFINTYMLCRYIIIIIKYNYVL